MRYDYNTPIKDLPKQVQNDIWNYMKEGWDIYECNIGEKINDKITKKALLKYYTISDIQDDYPVDTLVEELNKNNK